MTKREIVAEMLNRGSVLVVVDGRRCDVPSHLKAGNLSLRFGYNLHPPIHDLTIDERGISGTLSFQRVPHHCVIPWEALWFVHVIGEPHVVSWPKDQPRPDVEVPPYEAIEVSPSRVTEIRGTPESKKRPNHLRLVGENE